MKKLIFFLLLLIALFFSPYFFSLKLKKAIVQSRLQNIPGTITFDNVMIDPFSGLVLEGITWENNGTVAKLPFLKLDSSLFSLVIKNETEMIFSGASVFYKNFLLISDLESLAPIKFNAQQISLRGDCTINGRIHKEGTMAYTNHSLIPPFSADSFTLRLQDAFVKKSGLSSLNLTGDLNLNTLNCSKNTLLVLILKLLRSSPPQDMEIECGNIAFKVKDGIAAFDKSLFTIDHSYDIVSKATVNFVSGNLNILVGLTTSSLIKAFDFTHLPEGYIIPFKIKGSIQKPNIEIKDAAKAIASLLLLKQIAPDSRHYPKVQSF